jgi:hypothetical protein
VLLFNKTISFAEVLQIIQREGFAGSLAAQLLLYPSVVMSTIPKRKHKRSDIEANYRNETKTF